MNFIDYLKEKKEISAKAIKGAIATGLITATLLTGASLTGCQNPEKANAKTTQISDQIEDAFQEKKPSFDLQLVTINRIDDSCFLNFIDRDPDAQPGAFSRAIGTYEVSFEWYQEILKMINKNSEGIEVVENDSGDFDVTFITINKEALNNGKNLSIIKKIKEEMQNNSTLEFTDYEEPEMEK